MPLRTWLAAFNLNTCTWVVLDVRAQFDPAEYDLFELTAIDRNHATRLAQQARFKALSVTDRQRALLDQVRAQAGDTAKPRNVDVPQGQRGTAKQLAKKGLLLLRERDGSVVRPTATAFIPSLMNFPPA